jgi:branched-chain amino acid transport system substrate-binding protein
MRSARSAVIGFIAASVCMLLASSPSFAQASAQSNVLEIGMITSITGPVAPAFKPMYDAVKPTEELINRRGGVTVGGRKYSVRIIAEDDQSSGPGAVAAISKLAQRKIKFVVAPLYMPPGMAIIPTGEESKILRMKPIGMGPEEVNAKIRYGFLCNSTLYTIAPCFDYLEKRYPQAKKVAVIMPDDPGAVIALHMNEDEVKKRGLQLVFSEKFKPGSEDFYPILTKLLAQKPDVINLPISIIPWSVGIISQARELGFKGPIFSPGYFGDINIVNGMLPKQFAYDLFHGGPDVLSDKMTPIVKDLRKLVEEAKVPFMMESVYTLEGVNALVQCIEKAQSFDVEKVAAAIEQMKSVETVWGKARWGGKDIYGVDHVLMVPITLSRIENGKVEQLDFIER